MIEERRIQRSEQPVEAARLFLEYDARRNDYAAFTLADGDGLVVVDARSRINSEAVAAVAPFAHATHAPETAGLLDFVTRGRPLHVRRFDLDGCPMFLAAVGGEAPPSAAAEAAMRRILS